MDAAGEEDFIDIIDIIGTDYIRQHDGLLGVKMELTFALAKNIDGNAKAEREDDEDPDFGKCEFPSTKLTSPQTQCVKIRQLGCY